MEPASAVASLIGLAVLSIDTTRRLRSTLAEIQDIPGRFHSEHEWLTNLQEVLINIERTGRNIDGLGIGLDTAMLDPPLRRCYALVQALDERVENKLRKIDGHCLRRRLAMLIAVYISDEIRKTKDNIDQCVRELSLCYQELTVQLSLAHYGRTRHNLLLTSSTRDDISQVLKRITAIQAKQLENEKLEGASPSERRVACSTREVSDDCHPRFCDGQESLLQLAACAANASTVDFLLERGAEIDSGVKNNRASDLSSLLTSWSIPARNQSKRLRTMKLLLDAGSGNGYSYYSMVKSWLISPYDLQEALSLILSDAHRPGAVHLHNFLSGGTLIDPLKKALYTYKGPLQMQSWAHQLVDAALRLNLDLGADLQNGVLYFDGPLKFLLWVEDCLDGTSPPPAVFGLQSRWFDELSTNSKFAQFKAWFSALIYYDQQRDTHRPQGIKGLERYVKPTIHAFFGGHVAAWFSALHDVHLDVHLIAAQTYTMVTGHEAAGILECMDQRLAIASRPLWRKYLFPSYYRRILTTEDLKDVMAAVFGENGHNVLYKDGPRCDTMLSRARIPVGIRRGCRTSA